MRFDVTLTLIMCATPLEATWIDMSCHGKG
jgi:hypothetical protein